MASAIFSSDAPCQSIAAKLWRRTMDDFQREMRDNPNFLAEGFDALIAAGYRPVWASPKDNEDALPFD